MQKIGFIGFGLIGGSLAKVWRKKHFGKAREIEFMDGDLFVYDLSKGIWQERRAEVKKVY